MENINNIVTTDENVDVELEYFKIENHKNRGVICKNFVKINESISQSLKDIVINFLSIGKLLNIVKDNKLFVILNYSNIYDYSMDQYSLSRTTVKNLINVYNRFCEVGEMDPSKDTYYLNSVNLKKEFKEYNYSQLVELLPLSDEEIKDYSPSQSVKEIRNNKLISYITKNLNDNEKLIDGTKLKFAVDLIISYFKDKNINVCKYKVTRNTSPYNQNNINIQVEFKDLNNGLICLDYEMENYQFTSKIRSLIPEAYVYNYYRFESDDRTFEKFIKSTLDAFCERYNSYLVEKANTTKEKKVDTKKYDGFVEKNSWLQSAQYVKEIETEVPGTVDKKKLIFTTNSGSTTIIKSKEHDLSLSIDRNEIKFENGSGQISKISFYDLAKDYLRDYLCKMSGQTSDQVIISKKTLQANDVDRALEKLELYKGLFNELQLETEHDSYDDSWGVPQDFEILKSNNPDVEMCTSQSKIIDLFKRIKELEV